MPHLNLDLDFFGHRKTKRLVGLLSRGAEVLPLKLFCYCGKYHSEDGRLAGYTVQEIESIVEWWGKPGEAVKAMMTVVFLERDTDGTYFVHGWLEIQGHIAALRDRNKRNAQARWDKVRDACQTDATGMRGQCSLPSDPNYISRENSKVADTPDEIDIGNALEAFGRWSGKERGYGLREHENEHRPVLILVSDRAQAPPILRGTETLRQAALIPQVVDVLMGRGSEFKTVKYAVGSVKGELEQWAAKGMPGTQPKRGSGPAPPKATPAGEWTKKSAAFG